MNWMTGIQNAIDYIEEHITEELDYDAIAAEACYSAYHFQRVFGLMCGVTLGEYIRRRRLTLAGAELSHGDAKVIDVALKYGYESPDSFAKAFAKFHGILPSEAKRNGSRLRSFSRLVLNVSFEGGDMLDYRLEEKEEMILTGFRSHFTGTPCGRERKEQEERLFVTTRGTQWFLGGAARADNRDPHCVMTDITEEGYDYYYCHALGDYERKHLYDHETTGVDFVESMNLETLVIPRSAYVVFETSNVKNSVSEFYELLGKRVWILTEWMPQMGIQLKQAPELVVYHWMPETERRVEIWMPVEKKKGQTACFSTH